MGAIIMLKQAEAISRIVRQIKKEALNPPDQGNFKATP